MLRFSRYIGIDYSGAQTPTDSLKGIRIYSASPTADPVEILPPPGRRKYWSRRDAARWLIAELREGPPTLVGIDHAFSFPHRYFETHSLRLDWDAFLDDFHRHWPTDEDNTRVDFIRLGRCGDGARRTGDARWRRLCDVRSRAKSPFHFDVQGSVAKSTHAGLPWLRRIRAELGARVHFWPFDGWMPAGGVSVIAEAYPSLWSRTLESEGRTPDQHDAFSVARWMREADANGKLPHHFQPELSPSELKVAKFEGWILGLA